MSVCLSVCLSVGRSVQKKICPNYLNIRILGKCLLLLLLKNPSPPERPLTARGRGGGAKAFFMPFLCARLKRSEYNSRESVIRLSANALVSTKILHS